MITFSNVTVVPFDGLLQSLHGGHDHKGGPIWPDWDNQIEARFNRNGTPSDTRPDDVEPAVRISGGDWFWGGPVHSHFGHGIVDYSTRIAESLRQNENAKLVFSSEKRQLVAGLDDAPKWFEQMLLEWFQVPPERIHFVAEPTLFETLHVVPQAEQNSTVGPTEDYLDILDEVTARHFSTEGKQDTVYVSRAGIAGKFAGEVAFEAAMKAAGVSIFRPETSPLAEQLRVFASAERLIVAEGSALHGMQLLGRSLGDITIINRRRGGRLAKVFLKPRAKSLEYLNMVGGMVYGLTEAGNQAQAVGISFMQMERVLSALESRGIPIKDHWDQQAYDAEIVNDLMVWLRRTSHDPSSKLPDSRDLIYSTLEKSGFASWVPRAKEMLKEDRMAV
jgi:hypothetical protein